MDVFLLAAVIRREVPCIVGGSSAGPLSMLADDPGLCVMEILRCRYPVRDAEELRCNVRAEHRKRQLLPPCERF